MTPCFAILFGLLMQHGRSRKALQPPTNNADGKLRMLRDVRRAAVERERSVAMNVASDSEGRKLRNVVSRGGVANSAPPKKQKPNERCACGSGRKHKKCCGAAA